MSANLNSDCWLRDIRPMFKISLNLKVNFGIEFKTKGLG